MSFTLVQNILGSECIGTSRQKIVDNFTSLEGVVISLSANTINVTDSNTIDFSYSNTNRNLTAEVKNNSIESIHLQTDSVSTNKIIDLNVIHSKLATIASAGDEQESVQPRLAKAWVNFDGTTSPPTIRSSFNVLSVTKNSVGDYTINFTSNLNNANYSVAATSRFTTSNVTNAGFGASVTVHPNIAPTESALRIWNTAVQKSTSISNIVSEADSSHISVQIFSE